jgi:thiamine-phosphate pyrophosphorylase
MASQLARAKLARLASALNARNGRGLPALILMTDEARVPDPVAAARDLPKGAAIIVRHTDAARRRVMAEALMAIARARGLLVLIAGDAALARRIGAHGLHLPEIRASEAAHWKALRPTWLITVAAHSERALYAGAAARADAALLAPLFPTASHRERAAMGPARFRMLVGRGRLPVYALGGVNGANAAALNDSRACGLAAIDGLLSD